MNVNRMGTFRLDDETVTGFFVNCTITELREIPFNPLLARVELHPLDVSDTLVLKPLRTKKMSGKTDILIGNEDVLMGSDYIKKNYPKRKIYKKKSRR